LLHDNSTNNSHHQCKNNSTRMEHAGVAPHVSPAYHQINRDGDDEGDDPNRHNRNFNRRALFSYRIAKRERKYKCNFCGRRFTSISHRSRHMLSVHLGVRHTCPWCRLSYTRRDLMERHIRSTLSCSLRENHFWEDVLGNHTEQDRMLRWALQTPDEIPPPSDGPSHRVIGEAISIQNFIPNINNQINNNPIQNNQVAEPVINNNQDGDLPAGDHANNEAGDGDDLPDLIPWEDI